MIKYEVDATNQTLGRLSSKIAVLLRGKNLPTFEPHETPNFEVLVKNIKKLKFTGGKLNKEKYYRYSGYPGGIRELPLAKLWEDKPQHVIRQSVYNMLPKNKTRDKIIKNLKFE